MSTYPPLFARPPLEMHKYFTNMVEQSRSTTHKSSSAQNDYHGNSESSRDDGTQDEAKLLRVLEKVRRLLPCGWHDCPSNLSSLENLTKHLKKRHCQPLSLEEVKSTSSSRPYRCHYDSCQNKLFYDSSALFEHALEAHLYPLRLRCPILKCKYTAPGLGHLVQHFSIAHNTIPDELPRSMIIPISTVKLSLTLPALPDQEDFALTSLAMVKTNPSFNSSKATQNMKELLEYAALIEVDDDDDIPSSPYARIDIPKPTDYVEQNVRPTPRWEHSSNPFSSKVPPGLDDLPPLEAGGGPTFGYLVWKQRFEKAEKTGKLPFAYNSKKRR